MKQPGWGLQVLDRRINEQGEPQALVLPPDHEAPYWEGLHAVAQHRARTIYRASNDTTTEAGPMADQATATN